MKIIRNRFIPFGDYYAINLFGVIFAKGECDRRTINHESIHTAQMRELAFIPFYLIYLLEWFIKVIIYRSLTKAYFNISFEREAYFYDNDFIYLSGRKPYAFLKFFRKPNSTQTGRR